MKVYKVYKVVKRFEDELRSYNRYPDEPTPGNPVDLLYVPGKWTKPMIAGTPLWAHATRLSARDNVISANGNELWLAEATNVRAFVNRNFPDVKLAGVFPNNRSRLAEIWIGWKTLADRRKPGDGILLCEKIKLVQRLLW